MRVRSKIVLILAGMVGLAAASWFGAAWVRSLPLAEARRALDSGQYSIAAQLAEAHLNEGSPHDPEALLLAARAYARLGKWPEAEAYFSQIPLRDPEDLRLRARGLESRRLWIEASIVYEQILHSNRLDGDALQHLSAIRVQQDRTQEGLILARRLAQVPSYEVIGHVISGMLESQVGNHARAVEEFEVALQMSPDLEGLPTERWQLLELLAQALIHLGRAEEAENYATEAREQSSTPGPCFILGQARQQIGDEDGALNYWKEAIARDPKHVASIIEIAQFYLRRREAKEALSWASRAQELEPENSIIKYRLDTINKLLKQQEKSDGAPNSNML